MPIRPGREALRISQDRIIEKDFLSDLGLKTAPYQLVEDLSSLQTAQTSASQQYLRPLGLVMMEKDR